MSDQPSIFDAMAVPVARHRDPITSYTAADSARRFAGGHRARILEGLNIHGPLAACEMDLIGLTVVQADRRLPELAKAGLIRVLRTDDGHEITRRGCRVWMLT